MFKFLLIVLALSHITKLYAFIPKPKIFQHKRIMLYTPHIFNPKFFSFEFGYVTKKEIKGYHYNAFAKALIAEEFYTTSSQLRAGALGAKAGVFLPTWPWIPLFVELAFGYAKTSLHKDPWLGKREDSLQTKSLLLLDGGISYLYKQKIIYRFSYQTNNNEYFTKKIFFSVGANY